MEFLERDACVVGVSGPDGLECGGGTVVRHRGHLGTAGNHSTGRHLHAMPSVNVPSGPSGRIAARHQPQCGRLARVRFSERKTLHTADDVVK